MIRKIRRLHKLFLCLLFYQTGFPQSLTNNAYTTYPKDYFRWPLNLVPAIAGNFGELRPNHYHMGLDCRTDQKQNQLIVAAAGGYIAKVKIEPSGFGRCIYINHPNGMTTVYAHLNDFEPELEKYITAEQYRLKSWRVFLDIPPHLFPVEKGQFIAYSGNTGGSRGPHLHFEIRDTKTEKVLNPLLFGFPLDDTVPPVIFRLAMYDRTVSTYEQGPKIFAVRKIKGVYSVSPSLLMATSNKVSFAISAVDRRTGSQNGDGIHEAILSDNEQPVVSFLLDNISYDETRYLNAHIDYRLRSTGGPLVQHLSELPGYPDGIYKKISGDGVISLDDTSTHQIKVEVKDEEGNTSTLQFHVKRQSAAQPIQPAPASHHPGEFHPGFVNVFETGTFSVVLPENSLYDSIRLRYREFPSASGFTVYQLHDPIIPVHSYFPVKIKATVPAGLEDKVVMERSGKGNDFKKASPTADGWYRAEFRAFGNFRLLIDTTPPSIVPLGFKDNMNCSKKSRIAFAVSDNTEMVKSFAAYLDGNWLRFTNDKGRAFIYTFDERCGPGEHELKIVATDQVGNVREKIYHFTR